MLHAPIRSNTSLLPALVALMALAGCGVDGAPDRPDPPPGVAVSMDGYVGLRGDL